LRRGGRGEGGEEIVGARGKGRERDAKAGGSLWEFVIARSSAQGRGEEGANGGFWVRIGMRREKGEIPRAQNVAMAI